MPSGGRPSLRGFMSSDPSSLYSRTNPFPATHPVNRRLSGDGSGKDTRHHEISLAGSGLNYEVGDSLGLFAANNPSLVAEIIATKILLELSDEDVYQAMSHLAGYVDITGAVWIGGISSVICWLSVTVLKAKLGYDDSLDAFGVHGVGGIWGAIASCGAAEFRAIRPASS
jgi:hypothetical protein